MLILMSVTASEIGREMPSDLEIETETENETEIEIGTEIRKMNEREIGTGIENERGIVIVETIVGTIVIEIGIVMTEVEIRKETRKEIEIGIVIIREMKTTKEGSNGIKTMKMIGTKAAVPLRKKCNYF